MCSSSTSGYSLDSSSAISRHSRDDSRTLALSTDARCFRRPLASSKPTLRMRSISLSVYFSVSTPLLPRDVAHRFFGRPK